MKIHTPAMAFVSPEAQKKWEGGLANNQDPYGNACYRFASEWATIMEKELTGSPADWVPKNADRLSAIADTEGITGFMYGMAMSMLSECWVHGEILRRWHNKETQIGTEGDEANASGGVLNPALLSIGN